MNLNKYIITLVAAFLTTMTQGVELSGRYRGVTVNTNIESNLPERTRLALVSTLGESGKLTITGTVRMLLDDAKSEQEFVEFKLISAQWNIVNEMLTFKTTQYGLTFKLRTKLLSEGILKGEVYSVVSIPLCKFS